VLPPVSIVWPCSLSVDEYLSAGRTLEFPRPDCPSCRMKMQFWSGYRRQIREDGQCRSMWVPRVRCDRCRATHALFPAFVLVGRLDVVETVGEVLEAVLEGPSGVRPAAASVRVPHTTAREWLRRFGSRASEMAVAFAALAAELGGDVIAPLPDVERYALAALRGARRAALAFPGWLGVGRWRFVSAVTGGRLIATNMNMPYLIVGKRRFMPPVP
jgi:transposase-like protein